ncbi:MAG: PEP-CTERM sorting domain-containing protein [Planctomycetota bacterium]
MKRLIVLVMVLGVMPSMALGDYLFDFDDADNVQTAAGYTSVTRNNGVYSAAQSWGFVNGGTLSDNNIGGLWAVGDDKRAFDAVYSSNNWGNSFRINVAPGQDYTVSVLTGVPGYYSVNAVEVQGVDYSLDTHGGYANASTPPTVPGVMKIYDALNGRTRLLEAEDAGPINAATTAGEKHWYTYNGVKAYGYNNNGDYYNMGYYYNDEHRSEFMFLDNISITAAQLLVDADGSYITVAMRSGAGQKGGFVAIEVIPEPATIMLLGGGLIGLLRRRR